MVVGMVVGPATERAIADRYRRPVTGRQWAGPGSSDLETVVSRRRISLVGTAVVLAFSTAGLAGCSKASNALTNELVCEAAEELGETVADVAREVRVRDLDDAQDDVRDLRREFNRLEGRMERLSDAQRKEIEPLLAPADEAIAALEAASTLDEMSAALDDGRGTIDALAAGVESTLRCD